MREKSKKDENAQDEQKNKIGLDWMGIESGVAT
jgi:hypothetical protein